VKLQRGALATRDPLSPAPHLREHTREMLGEMGYGAGEIETLTASGVCGRARA